ncbi:MAG: maleate cis-trans isomerase, partial [Gammaproteobacteria bacterium]
MRLTKRPGSSCDFEQKVFRMTHHFGVLIPSANTTVETEYTRHLPHSLQAH